MSCNRFEGLLSFLHVVDRDTEATLKQAGDKLAKFHPLNEHNINTKINVMSSIYQPNMEVSIDERTVRSKAQFHSSNIFVINLQNGVSSSGVFVIHTMLTL